MQISGNLSVGAVGGDEGRQGDGGRVGEQLRNLVPIVSSLHVTS